MNSSSRASEAPQDTSRYNTSYIDYLTAEGLKKNASDKKERTREEREADEGIRQSGRLRRIWHGVRLIWGKRPQLSFALYAIVFTLVTATAVVFLQASMYTEPQYDDPDAVDDTTKILNSVAGRVTQFISQIWLEQKYQALLNFIVLGVIYLALILLMNRFWIPTAIFGSVITAFSVANYFKVQLRSEPIILADLNFVAGGNSTEIMSFIPEDGMGLVKTATTGLIWFACICFALQILDRRGPLIPVTWRPSRFVSFKNITLVLTRILAAALTCVLVFSFTWNLGTTNSWSYRFAQSFGDSPEMWNALGDASNNGPALTFLRLAHAKVMDEPEGYSEETMREIAERYSTEASTINASRANNLTDSTVIMVLSETFSDPLRVPGISFDIDPMPNIRQLKEVTTSGLMLSPGYGGGTANIEYQALTGLNLSNFDASLSVPYQQLVPSQTNPYAFNQIWNDAYGEDASIAFHPFNKNMYFRGTNYSRFNFSKFMTIDSDPPIEHQDVIGSAWYISDESSYQNVLDELNSDAHESPQFIQLVTMQNHMPYNDFYEDNEFKNVDTSSLGDEERVSVETYVKGISITDQVTTEFLNQLNQINEPITVIFYGDHLPGIYSTAAENPDNAVVLHETDYFIWSNQASTSNSTKLAAESSAFTSSNYFMSSAAEHMNAKVSPYLAMLSRLHQEIPAMSRAVTQSEDNEEDDAVTYLDAYGNLMDPDNLSENAQRLLEDYRLVQYDMTVGRNYLAETNFTTVPAS
ncbi:Phosphoglycerol transferase [Bifidobacterium lemurum]|uniref:Phosphoglycerol transferase n=2 Tax=Bifidobacterium lemurum TaxID=1603886 RepID=A0A261FS22_9BIFI|nr:Phosphoglycerol transferase [Bifidobacterium lemurum]